MGNALYSSYKLPEGDFKLQQNSISYSGGKMRGPENIQWECNDLKLEHIHVEAYNTIIFAAPEVYCSHAIIKAKHIYLVDSADFSGCEFLGQVHVDTLENIKSMLTSSNEL